MIVEIIKFILYSGLIVLISKYILVSTLRKLAEALNLKAKTVGDIAGYATSVPELLTITTSSLRGLTGASVYNILSSNVINLIQYLGAILLNKNTSKLRNRAIITDLVLVFFTIAIPIAFLKLNIELKLAVVPLFVILYILFRVLNNHVHKLYLKNEDVELAEEIEEEREEQKKNTKKVLIYAVVLIVTGILLFVIGELLGNTLENLCNLFGVSEVIVGILLGFVTSLPELITFFEAQRHYKKVDDDMLGVVEATNNLLTSNILNLFAIQTVGILISSIILKV
jgi:Ca2+/Na+ antiporter